MNIHCHIVLILLIIGAVKSSPPQPDQNSNAKYTRKRSAMPCNFDVRKIFDGYHPYVVNVTISQCNEVVTSISSDLVNMHSNLNYIMIRNTHAKKIEVGAFSDATRIEEIHIRNNKIDRIPKGVFNFLNFLKLLDLTKNSIEIIEDGAFLDVDRLETLLLSHNLIENASEVKNLRRTLKKLDLSHNKIKAFAFKDFEHLEVLKLGHNGITELSDFANAAIIHIDLTGNLIGYIHENSFKEAVKLTELNLSNNRLNKYDSGKFPLQFLKYNRNLKHLDLRDNGLKCCNCLEHDVWDDNVWRNLKIILDKSTVDEAEEKRFEKRIEQDTTKDPTYLVGECIHLLKEIRRDFQNFSQILNTFRVPKDNLKLESTQNVTDDENKSLGKIPVRLLDITCRLLLICMLMMLALILFTSTVVIHLLSHLKREVTHRIRHQ